MTGVNLRAVVTSLLYTGNELWAQYYETRIDNGLLAELSIRQARI